MVEPLNPSLEELLVGFGALPEDMALSRTISGIIDIALNLAEQVNSPLSPKPHLYLPNHNLQVVHLSRRGEVTTVNANDFATIASVQTELLRQFDQINDHSKPKLAFIADASKLEMTTEDLDPINYLKIAHSLGLHQSFEEQIMILSLPEGEEMGEAYLRLGIDAIEEVNAPLLMKFSIARDLYTATQSIIERHK